MTTDTQGMGELVAGRQDASMRDDRNPRVLVRRLTTAALRDPLGVLSLPARELDLTLRLIRRARLLGYLAACVREHVSLESLPRPVGDHLASAWVYGQARARVGRWELDRIDWALGDEAPSPLVALKGCAYLLAETPNRRGRFFNDVDLMVRRSELPRVEARLKERGWASAPISPYDDRYYRSWAHELPALRHREREVELDLHHNLLMATARLRPSADLLLAAATPVPGSRFHVLAPVDMVLHAMTHLLMGEMEDGLRELVDVDQLLRHFGAREQDFWERFWPRAERLDLARPAYYGLRYASRYLDTPVPAAVLAASQRAAPPAPVLGLMDRLVPDALFPPHPDARGRKAGEGARMLLLARAHWLRMPPLMLARHLGYKFYLRHWPGKQAGE